MKDLSRRCIIDHIEGQDQLDVELQVTDQVKTIKATTGILQV